MDNDPKDRHVAAAAVKTRSTLIVTDNVRDFGGGQLPGYGITIVTPASLVTDLLSDDPNSLRVAVEQMAARKQRHPRQQTMCWIPSPEANPSSICVRRWARRSDKRCHIDSGIPSAIAGGPCQ